MRREKPRRRAIPRALLPSFIAFAVALSLFLASVFFLNLNLVRLRESFSWVQHTDDVLLQLAAIEANLVDAESAERGYLLTGDADYLRPYERARVGIDRQLQALAQQVSDNATQLARAKELQPLVDARMAVFQRAIALGPARLEDARAVVRAAKDQRLTQIARERIEQLRQTELGFLGERQRSAEGAATLSALVAAGAGMLSLTSAGLGLFFFQRQRSRYSIRELQTELLHLSRLTTMGQTASMMAHEIRQPLTATSNYLQGVRRMVEAAEAPPPGKIREALQKASAQVERAAEILGRLRRFVERRERERQEERIDGVIDEAIALMAVDTAGVTLRRSVAPNLPAVMIDRVEVQQVLINLMRNAIEAMEGSARRELTVSAERDPAEQTVRVSVRDSGPGLPPAVAERLFQPFISTKPAGMGVGLSICRTIIEGQGGRIWAAAAPEGGTVFHFTLPVAAARRAA